MQSLFVEVALRAEVRLVRSALAVPNLVWLGILSAETTFHELKAIQGLLRSRTPESIRYEVAGHVVLFLLVCWLMVEAAQRAAADGDPLGLSFKHALE